MGEDGGGGAQQQRLSAKLPSTRRSAIGCGGDRRFSFLAGVVSRFEREAGGAAPRLQKQRRQRVCLEVKRCTYKPEHAPCTPPPTPAPDSAVTVSTSRCSRQHLFVQ